MEGVNIRRRFTHAKAASVTKGRANTPALLVPSATRSLLVLNDLVQDWRKFRRRESTQSLRSLPTLTIPINEDRDFRELEEHAQKRLLAKGYERKP